MPEVSIIMPVFNGEQFIAKAIQSVLDQGYKDWELICIDDGSTDNSSSIIKSFHPMEHHYLVALALSHHYPIPRLTPGLQT